MKPTPSQPLTQSRSISQYLLKVWRLGSLLAFSLAQLSLKLVYHCSNPTFTKRLYHSTGDPSPNPRRTTPRRNFLPEPELYIP